MQDTNYVMVIKFNRNAEALARSRYSTRTQSQHLGLMQTAIRKHDISAVRYVQEHALTCVSCDCSFVPPKGRLLHYVIRYTPNHSPVLLLSLLLSQTLRCSASCAHHRHAQNVTLSAGHSSMLMVLQKGGTSSPDGEGC